MSYRGRLRSIGLPSYGWMLAVETPSADLQTEKPRPRGRGSFNISVQSVARAASALRLDRARPIPWPPLTTHIAERRPRFALLNPICASAVAFAIVSSLFAVVVLLVGGAAAEPVISGSG